MKMPNKIINKAHVFLLLFAIINVLTIINLQKRSLNQISSNTSDIEDYTKKYQIEKANLELLEKIPAFGFDNLVANWTMFKFLQYFGDSEARKITDYSLSSKYFSILVDRDPNFTRAYFRIAPAVTLKAGHPEETIRILEKGLSQISPARYRANYLWVYKAVDELLFLGDTEGAIKSFETAAEWSSIIKDTPREKSARRTAKFLQQDPDSKTVQVGAWFSVWVGAPDTETRNLAQRKIERLGGRLEITEDGRVTAYPPQEERG
ncbi:MAG: hypothetical protein AAFQ80_00605 [Cyanobacteria bacterium J06621_8]